MTNKYNDNDIQLKIAFFNITDKSKFLQDREEAEKNSIRKPDSQTVSTSNTQPVTSITPKPQVLKSSVSPSLPYSNSNYVTVIPIVKTSSNLPTPRPTSNIHVTNFVPKHINPVKVSSSTTPLPSLGYNYVTKHSFVNVTYGRKQPSLPADKTESLARNESRSSEFPHYPSASYTHSTFPPSLANNIVANPRTINPKIASVIISVNAKFPEYLYIFNYGIYFI